MKLTFKEISLSIVLMSSPFIVQSAMAETTINSPSTLSNVGQLNKSTKQATLPSNFNAKILANSKIVYEELKLARKAALNKNKPAFIQALTQASSALDKLELPPSTMALDKQLGIIQLDITKPNHKLDPSLWSRLERHLRNAITFTPKKKVDNAISSIKKGQQAATSNNAKVAQKALNELINASAYNLGTFPISKVNQDIYSASLSIHSDYWPGAIEAVQSALATFHWYDQVPSYKLLSAYTDVVNAYTLATAPEFRPIQDQILRNQLSDAQDKLKQVPNCKDLVQEIEMLIVEIDPSGDEIKKVLQHIQLKINQEREKSEKNFLQKQ